MNYRFEIDICFDLEESMEEYSAWKTAEDKIYKLKEKYENEIFKEVEKDETKKEIVEVFKELTKTLEIIDDGIETEGNEEYHYYEGYSYDGANRISYTIYSYEE